MGKATLPSHSVIDNPIIFAHNPDVEPALVLGHCSSILTSLSVSPSGSLLATADRDEKIRVSRLPRHGAVLKGAPCIQTYCLGHTDYVSAVAFVSVEVRSCREGILRLNLSKRQSILIDGHPFIRPRIRNVCCC